MGKEINVGNAVMDPDVAGVITFWAKHNRQILSRAGYGVADVEQDIRLACLRGLRDFDSDRGSPRALASAIARNVNASHVAKILAHKRDVRRCVPLEIEQGKTGRMGLADRSPAFERHYILQADVQHALTKLPKHLAAFAEALMEAGDVHGAARLVNVSRATGYRRLAELRAALADAGFAGVEAGGRE